MSALPYSKGTKVHVYLPIPGWEGWCNGWVLEDRVGALVVECDDNAFTTVLVAKSEVHLGWRS
jgi:hypothetical protein